ncbi:MAG: electron transport complex subunit RsxG [Thiomargarita sp.]|nr:electron transport complex subunit RsxG [Thiomargarita sp.]
MLIKKMAQTAALLTLFAVLGGGLVAFSFEATHQRIEANKRAALLCTLNELIPFHYYDNDLFTDIREVQDEALLGTEEIVVIYRARKEGKPVAAVFNTLAPDGYNGKIHLLVGINYKGILMGVRVITHKETPGLGDGIELRRSDWILGFNGRSLINPDKGGWQVKRDGGDFDQLTGATITPRAIVKAVHKTLLFFQQYHEEVFAVDAQALEK